MWMPYLIKPLITEILEDLWRSAGPIYLVKQGQLKQVDLEDLDLTG